MQEKLYLSNIGMYDNIIIEVQFLLLYSSNAKGITFFFLIIFNNKVSFILIKIAVSLAMFIHPLLHITFYEA